MKEIRTVTVVGATGTMGPNVAGIFASFGNAKVFCVGRDIEKVKKTIPRIISSVRADSIAKNLIPADLSTLEDCVAKSDLVFESSAEDIAVKNELAKRIATALPDGAISCTGSSGLSITTIAECYPENLRSQFFGVHMFNPPYSMPLCELISTKYTDNSTKNDLKSYLETILLRTVVEVKDAPAFLANRIGFQFINEAMQYAEKYKENGGVDYIDAILGSFTGRTMPPLVTADFVGLDVHKAIVDNLSANTNDYAHSCFKLPKFAEELIKEGKLGRKSGEGLYKTIKLDNGTKKQMVFDISTNSYREKFNYVFPFSEEMKKSISIGDYNKALKTLVSNRSQEADICIAFLLRYIVYSLFCEKEVGYSSTAADDVMATGFNWCPPVAMLDALSSVTDIKTLIAERLGQEIGVDVCKLLSDAKKSKYDYRLYFRSGK